MEDTPVTHDFLIIAQHVHEHGTLGFIAIRIGDKTGIMN